MGATPQTPKSLTWSFITSLKTLGPAHAGFTHSRQRIVRI
jgi:hypothetical protein